MSATKEFVVELADYVWLIEFADITFEERGKARVLLDQYLMDRFGNVAVEGFNGFYDAAYELVDELGGRDYAFGKMEARLLGMIRPDNELVTK